MKRKIALFLSALFICTALSGCEKEEITLLSELYQGQLIMNGVEYSMPFTLDDLDENYTINTITESDELFHEIKYKDAFYAYAITDTPVQEEASPEKMAVSDIGFAENSGFELGEVRFGNTKSKIEKAHGAADYELEISDKEMVYYYLNESVTLSMIYENEKVVYLSFNFDGSVNELIEE